MKLETAIKQINKEMEFMGMTFQEVIDSVQKHTYRIYSQKTVEAADTIKFEQEKKLAKI
jgi:hypothetical protein